MCEHAENDTEASAHLGLGVPTGVREVGPDSEEVDEGFFGHEVQVV